MTPQQFLTEFGHIASAPNGVQRLREMVLQLAVLGALSEQDLKDGQASTLIDVAARKKREAVEKRLFKSSSKLESLAIEIPREIILPPNWGWVRLLDLGEINPRNECDDELDVSFLPMGAISQGHRGPLLPEKRKWSEIKKGFTHVADGDVILAKITPCFENGKSAVVSGLTNGFGAGTTEIHVFRALPDVVDIGYVYVFLRSPHFALVGESNMTGTAGQKRLPTEYFASRAMPFPPLAEQKRIVAKVDELMALCDKLEALQIKRKAARAVLTKEILGRVASDATVDPQTCLQNLSLLASDVDQVAVLRHTILSLAVQGKLVPQENASQVGVIQVSQDDRRKRALLGAIPKGWTLCYLGRVAQLINGDRGKNYPNKKEYITTGVPFINTGHIESDGRLSVSKMNYLTRQKFDSLRSGKVNRGDLLYCLRGATLGKTAIMDQFDEGAIASSLVIIRFNQAVLRKFAYYYLISPLGRQEIRLFDNGTAQPNLSANSVKKYLLPLPPLAEQKRIVAKVDELMALCDTLEAKLRKASQVQEQLAISSIAALTGIQSQEKETMKAPKTELVARLKIGKKPSTKDQAPLAALLVRHNGELDPKVLWQHSGMERIDDFYHQLKFEMNKGWIVQPEIPSVRVVGEG
ncbi:MAG: restriction endonuclease subunit S [Fibrobacterota bacterium]|nr:MAG: restriction endonuclease subunit S [Fibrobacterota bacterium]